jgi:hypothetical protein
MIAFGQQWTNDEDGEYVVYNNRRKRSRTNSICDFSSISESLRNAIINVEGDQETMSILDTAKNKTGDERFSLRKRLSHRSGETTDKYRRYGSWVKNLYLDHQDIRVVIDDRLLARLLDSVGPSLRRLDLSFCDELVDPFSLCTTTFPNLMAISLQGCINIGQKSLKILSKQCGPSLQIINFNNVDSMNDAVLMEFAKRCNNITGMSLNGCTEITDDSLSMIFVASKTRLLEVSLSDCHQVSDTSINVLSQHCSKLSYVRLTGCSQVTDMSLSNLVIQCPLVEYLFLARCSITDETIMKAVYNAKKTNLKFLDLAYCEKIHIKYLMELINQSKNLVSIGLGACEGMYEYWDFLKKFSDKAPSTIPYELRKLYLVIRKKNVDRLKEEWIKLYKE